MSNGWDIAGKILAGVALFMSFFTTAIAASGNAQLTSYFGAATSGILALSTYCAHQSNGIQETVHAQIQANQPTPKNS